MGAEYGDGAIGHLVQLFDKTGALFLELVHHMLVMDDLMADIDRLAILIERLLHDIDGAYDPGAKAAWLGKNDSHVGPDPLQKHLAAPGQPTHLGKVLVALQHSHFP